MYIQGEDTGGDICRGFGSRDRVRDGFFLFFFFVLETKAKFQFNFIDLSFACENIGRRNNINVGFFL